MTLTTYSDIEQGSDEWLAARRGMVTASTVGALLTLDPPDATTVHCPACDVDTGPCFALGRKVPTELKTVHAPRAAAAADLPPVIRPARNDTSERLTLLLVSERITGETDYREQYQSNDMLAGQLEEPLAREAYSGHYELATVSGFMVRDDWGFSIGYSPDGLVDEHGLIEVKSPRAKEHVRTVIADEVPPRYMAQLQAGLLVSGREWIDYVSFYGGQPLWTKRVYAQPLWQEAIVDAVAAFEQRAEEMTHAYDLATRGLPATERRIDLSTLHLEVI